MNQRLISGSGKPTLNDRLWVLSVPIGSRCIAVVPPGSRKQPLDRRRPLNLLRPVLVQVRLSIAMTIIRTGRDDLFIHSPTELTPELVAEVKAIGNRAGSSGPNRIHYWWVPDWNGHSRSGGPSCPGIEAQARGPIDFPFHELEGDHGYPWDIVSCARPARYCARHAHLLLRPHRLTTGASMIYLDEAVQESWASIIPRMRVASASIAKGLVIIDMPGSRKPFAMVAFSA